MADWGGAAGAGAGADVLRQMLTDKLLAAKVAEDNRRAQVQEAQQAQQLAQQAEAQRAAQAMQMTALTDNRDERYQNRLFDTRKMDADTQQRSMDQQMHARDVTEARTLHGSDRAADQAFTAGESEKNRAFQRLMLGQKQNGPPSEAAQLANEMARLRIQGETDKQEGARTERTRQAGQATESTQAALDSVKRLTDHPGLDAASGAYEMRGWTQPAVDFNAERDRLVAMLALPNLGSLKGPMSDKDILFIKQISSKLSNPKLSGEETRAELGRAKTFLESKLGGVAGGGEKPPGPAPGTERVVGGVPAVWDGHGWKAK